MKVLGHKDDKGDSRLKYSSKKGKQEVWAGSSDPKNWQPSQILLLL